MERNKKKVHKRGNRTMKKWIYMIVGVISALILYFGIIAKLNEQKAIAIIGGADGPTSIFIAGKVGYGSILTMIIVGVIIIVGIIVLIKRRK